MNNVHSFRWNWTEFCETGLKPFATNSTHLLPCFQIIVLQLPIYTIFAALSAFHFGKYTYNVSRDSKQLKALTARVFISIFLSLLPICKLFIFHLNDVHLDAADILVACTECIMWTVHCGYLITARRYGELNHRGPFSLYVVWLTIFVLDILWLYTSLQYNWWKWSLATILGNIAYYLTFSLKGNAIYVRQQQHATSSRNSEQEPPISPRYTYFHFDFNETHLGHAQDEANIFSRFIFHWVGPLISKGVAGGLKRIEDLFDLPDALHIDSLSERMHNAILQTRSLFRALHRAFGREFYLIGILRFIADTSGFAGPLLLGALLSDVPSTNKDEINLRPYLYALGLFTTTLLSALCSTHFNWRMSLIGMKMRIGVVTAIYRKALEARDLKDSKPEILNLMSTDTDRIVNSCISIHSFWSIPFQLFTTLYLLYTQLGAAFIAGVLFAAALIPINRWVAQRIGVYSSGLMTAKDARLSVTRETLSGARQIKLHAWEDIFINKINRLRQTEVKYLSRRKYLDALCVYFWATTPVLMCFLTFGVFALMGEKLVASTTYTSVALLNMLIGPLNAFPWVLNGIIEAWVSIKRVQELIDLPNLDIHSYYQPINKNTSLEDTLIDDAKPVVLQLKDASFVYGSMKNDNHETPLSDFRLEHINLKVKRGDLVCIEGPVGGGKSMFLSAIVAALHHNNGEICIEDVTQGLGYVAQSPWLQRGTIRDNIVWGSAFDMTWYKSVLYACALNEDIEALGGDLVGVGENGHTLSGGQRARISLARAVYQDKSIYILDDILASLDAHVAQHISKYCILGLLKKKTRIIVTRNIFLYFHATQILHIEGGIVSPSDYMANSIDLSFENEEQEEQKVLRRTSLDLDELQQRHEQKSLDSVMLEESREYGHISKNVFRCYWQALTTPLALTVLIFVVLMQLSRNMSDTWLAHWVTDTTLNEFNYTLSGDNSTPIEPPHSTKYYLSIYAVLTLGNSALTLIRAFIFAYGGLRAAKFMHEQLLYRVLFAKFSFFDLTSVGRILNRFSSDTYTIDDSLPFILNILLSQLVGLIGAIFVSMYAMPLLALVKTPMIPIYLNLQQRYRHASRDIKRLSSNALSPLYTHFTETLEGIITIRSMRASPRFQRDFQAKLEESIKAQLTAAAAQQWLSFRLQIMGSLLVGCAGLFAAITSANVTSPGQVGLAISYALSIASLLGGLLNAIAETEQELIAVERINEYLQLESEHNTDDIVVEPPFGWPTQGALCFDNVELRYREHLPISLHNLTFETAAFERLAIVGRTGSGKSSIFYALMRITSLSQGCILLDCINVRSLTLSVLRSRIGIIPQEPFLFEGSVRENLDPRHEFHDSEILHAMSNCTACTLLVQSLGGLDGWLEQNGVNLSAGQRQLLCLGRALLKNAKVICIDEGTSNLDDDCEMAMQQALRHAFKRSTILFIAHRLRGLHNMDRIIVMDNGTICEQGTPSELANNSMSIFHGMLQAQHINLNDYNVN